MKTLGLASFTGCLIVAVTVQAGGEADLKKEHTALQGVWKIIGFETPDGKKDDLNDATMEFDRDGKTLTFTKGNDTKKGTFKLNPAGKPKEIDIKPNDDNKTFEGIYEIKGKTLKLCLCPDGNDGRPSEFAIKDGKKHVLITMERAK